MRASKGFHIVLQELLNYQSCNVCLQNRNPVFTYGLQLKLKITKELKFNTGSNIIAKEQFITDNCLLKKFLLT